jgi:hypothetical protein
MDQPSVASSGAGHQKGSWTMGLWSSTDSDRAIQWIASKISQAHMLPAPNTQKPINVSPKALFEVGRGAAVFVESGSPARSLSGSLEGGSISGCMYP